MLIIQIALGIVLGFLLLTILPYVFSAMYTAISVVAKGVGFVLLFYGSIGLLYAGFYLGWHLAVSYIPAVILISASVVSVLSLAVLAWLAIREKIPLPLSIWFYALVVVGVALITFISSYDSYKQYGQLGNEANFTAPFFIFFGCLGWGCYLLFKKGKLSFRKVS